MSKRRLQIAIVNLMPDPQVYHLELTDALSHLADRVQIHWARLQSQKTAADRASFSTDHHRPFASIAAATGLDAIVITGAPVELLEFEEIGYWNELRQIIAAAHARGAATLGICWGALAVGKILGLGKSNLAGKVFGVFDVANVASGAAATALPDKLILPFSIRAQFTPTDVERCVARGEIEVLGASALLPHAVVQSSDRRHLMCLAHPEYGPMRLINEWHRDRRRQPSLPVPFGVNPASPMAQWRASAQRLLEYWLDCVESTARLLQPQKAASTVPESADGSQSTCR